MGLSLPFGLSLSYILLYAFQFLRFLSVVKLHFNPLVCPVLPSLVPDDTDWYEIFPGIRGQQNVTLELRMNLIWTPYRSEKIVFVCTGGRFAPGTFPRGVYRVEDYHIVLKDWGGFFFVRTSGVITSPLSVYPGVQTSSSRIRPEGRMNSERTVASSVLKNQDQFDARPYIAGDDPRRIHWKMLARHEELFVREGSSIIRDRKGVLFVVDGRIKAGGAFLRSGGAFENLDRLLRYLSGVLDLLEGEDLSLKGIFSGIAGFKELGSLSQMERRSFLASIPPGGTGKLPEPLGQIFGSVLLFSTTGPTPSLLETLERQYPSADRKLILPGEISPVPGRRGWTVVKT